LDDIWNSFLETNSHKNTHYELCELSHIFTETQFDYIQFNLPYLAIVQRLNGFDVDWIVIKLLNGFVNIHMSGKPVLRNEKFKLWNSLDVSKIIRYMPNIKASMSKLEFTKIAAFHLPEEQIFQLKCYPAKSDDLHLLISFEPGVSLIQEQSIVPSLIA
jgi:hypothetical protein